MAAQPVEWVLVIYYGPSAHRATYGRLDGTKYTKDYIQLSRKPDFIDIATTLFPTPTKGVGTVPFTYKWPTGAAPGEFVFLSADRPHLKWDTRLGAPDAWRMSLNPSEATAETIPGNPSQPNSAAAEQEFALLQQTGAGQPYLMAIKLRDQPKTLHLRVYLANPSNKYSWADLQQTPDSIQALAEKTSQSSALAWSAFQSGGTALSANLKTALSQLAASESISSTVNALDAETGPELATYLRHPGYGLFFDPNRNHDAWLEPSPLPKKLASSSESILEMLKGKLLGSSQGDAAAETFEVSADEVKEFRQQIKNDNYAVPDSHSTVKTRGSAQRAFSEAVKGNYGFRCAITGIKNKSFLVAAHIVPWSVDQNIRLDPSNGICLSLLVDRAFENGHLIIDDNLIVHIDKARLGDDDALRSQLESYDGHSLEVPKDGAPKVEYLQRRRALVGSVG